MANKYNTTEFLGNSPYFDDFNSDKKYSRILFKGGYSVQARELTQIQTILEYKIGKLLSFIFGDNKIVQGCSTSSPTVRACEINNTLYGKLRDSDYLLDTYSYGPQEGVSSGTSGELKIIDVYNNDGVYYLIFEDDDFSSWHTNYPSWDTNSTYQIGDIVSNTTSIYKCISIADDSIEVTNTDYWKDVTDTVEVDNYLLSEPNLAEETTGNSGTDTFYAQKIEEGYIVRHTTLINVEEQYVISLNSGLSFGITEGDVALFDTYIVYDYVDDSSLLDNSSTANLFAPGADRLIRKLKLSILSSDDVSEDYVFNISGETAILGPTDTISSLLLPLT
jgi:hypothetical protein